jgi:DNA-binding MarR family transcriptional regulator
VTDSQFDELIHAPNRLKICALLASVEEAEFRTLREDIGVSDSVLSKQIRLLEEAGYIKIRKKVVKTGKKTWVSLTKAGKKAFARHAKELQRLAASAAHFGED